MQGIGSAPTATATSATPGTQTIQSTSAFTSVGSLWMLSTALCGGTFALLMATAVSGYLVRVATVETADWPHFLNQFAMPALPLALMAVLLGTRSHVSATLLGLGASILYVFLWMTLVH